MEVYKAARGYAASGKQRERFDAAREWLVETFGEEGSEYARSICVEVQKYTKENEHRTRAAAAAPCKPRSVPPRTTAKPRHASKGWSEHEDNALIDLVQREGSRVSDWDDKAKRFMGGGVRTGFGLQSRWRILKLQNKDVVGSARKGPSRRTHTYDVIGGGGWVKKRRTSTARTTSNK